MKRQIAVVCSAFTAEQEERLRSGIEAQGFCALFFRNNEETRGRIEDAEIVLGMGAELLREASGAKWFCSLSAGMDGYFAEDAAIPEGLHLTSSSGAYGVTIAEHILMVTLCLLRQESAYRQVVAERKWVRDYPVRSILGSRVTILGTGDIGRETALRLRGFSPRIVAGVNRSGREVPGFDRILPSEKLEQLLPETDILILCLPGTPETEGILSEKRIRLLPQNALVINVGRGSAVDEDALLAALREKRIAGAALDVFRREPLPENSPVWDTPGLLITPHCSGNMSLSYTADRIIDLFLEDLVNYCSGRPLEREVDLQKRY